MALPVAQIEAVLGAEESQIEANTGDAFFEFKGEPLPLLDLAEEVGLPRTASASNANVLVVEVRGFRLGLLVDRAVGDMEVFVRETPRPLSTLAALAGVAVLPDGAPVFVLEIGVLVERFL